MGVTRKILSEGNGVDFPKKGDNVTIEYTGNLYDASKADNDYRGNQSVHFHQWISARTDLLSDSTPPLVVETSRPQLASAVSLEDGTRVWYK
jgi:hypothetical protein